MTPEALARALEDFLGDCRSAAIVEDDEVVFELPVARYSVTAQHRKCLLHLWSDERNAVRRVLDIEQKDGCLALTIQRFGQNRPAMLQVLRDADRRTASARTKSRSSYRRFLQQVFTREFPGHKFEHVSTAMDLERSFSPVYTRGLLRKGGSAVAVLGVNSDEPQPAIDAALTFGLLWLDHCRNSFGDRLVIEGLRLVLPRGRSAVARARVAHLDHRAARFEICELDEVHGQLRAFDASDTGNIETRLIHCPDQKAVLRRFAVEIAKLRNLCPACDAIVVNSGEVSFRIHGLEFGRARVLAGGAFPPSNEITFGAGRNETALTPETELLFASLLQRLVGERTPASRDRPALWRMQPERWLESLLVRDITCVDGELDPACVYSQVPAFAAGDRAMIDVLAATHGGRLAVIEIKADEDIHLPLQGLDYWSRVNFHHQRGEFTRCGYFPGRELLRESPRLLLVAPSLRVHPATDALLRYLSPTIDWTLIGVNEEWRNGVHVIFRKSCHQRRSASA